MPMPPSNILVLDEAELDRLRPATVSRNVLASDPRLRQGRSLLNSCRFCAIFMWRRSLYAQRAPSADSLPAAFPKAAA